MWGGGQAVLDFSTWWFFPREFVGPQTPKTLVKFLWLALCLLPTACSALLCFCCILHTVLVLILHSF